MLNWHFSELQSRAERTALRALWNSEFPEQLAYHMPEALTYYLESLENPVYKVAWQNDKLVGWWAEFDREGERWFGMLLDRSVQGQGAGTALLSDAQSRNEALCGWVIDHDQYQLADGSPYPSPLAFYQKNGFTVLTDERLEIPRLSAVKIQWIKTAE